MTKDYLDDEKIFKKESSNFKLVYFIYISISIILTVTYYIFLQTFENTPDLDFHEYYYLFGTTVCGILSFIVAIKFRSHETFRTSYIALGIYFMLNAFGELIYINYFHILKIDSFPTMADVFFLSASIFAFIHIMMNINYFKKKISNKIKIVLPIFGILIILSYSLLSFNKLGEFNLNFFVGLLYSVNYSILLPLTILGMLVARKTILGATWVLLVTGILISSIAFEWWIFLEFFGKFSYKHPLNMLWLFSFIVISFALIEHLRVLSQRK